MMFPSNRIQPLIIAKNKGFSLIELMVVMAIMSVIMGLTGGLVTKTDAQQEKQVELEKVKHLFKQLSYQAFYQGNDIEVIFKGNQIRISDNQTQQTLVFKQLVFVAQNYTVSTNAVVFPAQFSIFWQDSIRHFPIDSIFTSYELAADDA